MVNLYVANGYFTNSEHHQNNQNDESPLPHVCLFFAIVAFCFSNHLMSLMFPIEYSQHLYMHVNAINITNKCFPETNKKKLECL